MADFEYVSGGHSTGWAWRVYRSKTGLVGKVTRTKRGRNNGEFGKSKTRYFVWALPDSAPEYATYGEALKEAVKENEKKGRSLGASRPSIDGGL